MDTYLQGYVSFLGFFLLSVHAWQFWKRIIYTEQQKKLYIDIMCIYFNMYINILTKLTTA